MGRLLLLALACPMLCGQALADKRVALVVGNSAYANISPLDNPRNDARLMGETLRSLGFTLIGNGPQVDLDKSGLDNAVQSFGLALQGADVGLFFYAGHGVQVRGSNYLVPVGANPTREADVDFQMVDVALVLRQMEGSGTKLNIVILDACRNNPFASRGLRAAEGGLAQMRAPEGTLISFATQPGNVAQDGVGGNSPYTKALAQTIQQPGLDIFQTFNEVGLVVKQTTGGTQQPWVSSSPIAGNFYFAGAPAGAPAFSQSPSPVLTADEMFWLTIRDSRAPALFEEFLAKFPSSRHVASAQARLSELKNMTVAALPRSLLPAGRYHSEANGYLGTWDVTVSGTSVSVKSNWTCCPRARIDLMHGQIEGQNITLTRDCMGQGASGQCLQVYTGQISGDTASGTFTHNGAHGGSWRIGVITPQKKFSSGRYRSDAGGHRGTWDLTIAGTSVSGKSNWRCCPGVRVDPMNGQIAGQQITLTRDCTGQGVSGQCLQVYTGRIVGDTASGTYTHNGAPSGSWAIEYSGP